MRNLLAGAIATSVFLLAGTGAARASTTTFSGQDAGAPISGPFPNSAAAESSFKTAASLFGTTNTITFESVAQGSYTPISAAPGVSIALTGPDLSSCSAALCGVSAVSLNSNTYAFNTTSGGSVFLARTAGAATFTFATPTHSFGAWFTGLQTFYTSVGDMTITFDDGSTQTLNMPANVGGGAQFFGFTSTVGLSSITVANLTNDAWGIDDVTYNVPEPAETLLTLAGIAALACHRVRSREQSRLP